MVDLPVTALVCVLMLKTKQPLPKNLPMTHGFDLSSSYAYGNHHSDVYKLELFGYPRCSKPESGSSAESQKKRNWQIEM